MKYLIYLLLLLSYTFYGQHETSNWYFGQNAALNFDRGQISVLNNSSMVAPAGCASISDENGNLLFYTNGETVWNKNHDIMENGEDLRGNKEHFQNSIIIPKPKSNSVYYIFYTQNTLPTGTYGIFYAEIHFTTANPNGIVKYKNAFLKSNAANKITAVHNKDIDKIWLSIFAKSSSLQDTPFNKLLAYEISENGISRFPVETFAEELSSEIGEMKFSPDGTKLAVADNGDNYIYLYDFNKLTGKFNHHTTIFSPLFALRPNNPISLAFSPNAKYLYYTANLSAGTTEILQFIIYPPTPLPLLFERKFVVSTVSNQNIHGGLQLALNGKIYVALYNKNSTNLTPSSKIGVINNPNKFGLESNYSHATLDLQSGKSFKGMPNFIQSYLRNRIITKNKCVFQEFNFEFDSYATVTSARWDFGDGNTSNLFQPNHTYNTPGQYTVSLEINFNNTSRTMYKVIDVYPLPNLRSNQKLIQCDNDLDQISTFNLNNIDNKVNIDNVNLEYTFFNNLNDAQNDQNPINDPENFVNQTNPQQIFFRAYNQNGCYDTGSFLIETSFNQINDIPNMNQCDDSDDIIDNQIATFNLLDKAQQIINQLALTNNETVSFYNSFNEAQTKLNRLRPFLNSQTKTIWFRIDTPEQCGGIGQFDINVVETPTLDNINDTYTICISPEMHTDIIIDAGNYTSFAWKDNNQNIISTNQYFQITNPGIHSVTVSNNQFGIECTNTKTFNVSYPPPPTVKSVEVTNNNDTNNIIVELNDTGNFSFALNNQNYFTSNNTYTFNNVPFGVHTIYIKDANFCKPSIKFEKTIVSFPNFFTPNNDGNNDTWLVPGINSKNFKKIDIKVFNRFGKLIFTLNDNNAIIGWDGTYNGIPLSSNTFWYNAKLTDINDKKIIQNGAFSLIKQ